MGQQTSRKILATVRGEPLVCVDIPPDAFHGLCFRSEYNGVYVPGGECSCGCGGFERRRYAESPSSVQRYVSAVTDRWSGRECSCRRRRGRGRRPACVCTAYRRVSDDRLAAVITLGARDLRRELDTIVLNADGDTVRDNSTAEVYVLSVAARPDSESSQECRRSELTQASDGSIRLHPHFQARI
ncbi:hypothetical protein MSG28_012771 [Choristoneura fumiferana]|uniref:Uncharacterized protein n=1 Tax=Choristoneura fumiferana TaxID=7141 RepID=A0ACC0JHY2_CHOFU|nr:hypothetical protein MSG28_012771 [Choristoneura fumiferana]